MPYLTEGEALVLIEAELRQRAKDGGLGGVVIIPALLPKPVAPEDAVAVDAGASVRQERAADRLQRLMGLYDGKQLK